MSESKVFPVTFVIFDHAICVPIFLRRYYSRDQTAATHHQMRTEIHMFHPSSRPPCFAATRLRCYNLQTSARDPHRQLTSTRQFRSLATSMPSLRSSKRSVVPRSWARSFLLPGPHIKTAAQMMRHCCNHTQKISPISCLRLKEWVRGCSAFHQPGKHRVHDAISHPHAQVGSIGSGACCLV
jgi:hypothetical protein